MTFKAAMWDAMDKYIPTKICKSREQLPYMTPDIVKLIKKRNRLYKKRQRAKKNFEYSTVGYQRLDTKIKDLRKEIQKKTRRAYWNYVESVVTPMTMEAEPRSGMKRFWQFIKSKRKDRTGVATLKVNGTTISDSKGKADALNQQFESVFTREGPLANDLLPASPYPAAGDIEINVAGVRKLLERLTVHKTAGPDRIGPQVLKNLACVVAPILTVIFRKSYETGCIPDDWRSACHASI